MSTPSNIASNIGIGVGIAIAAPGGYALDEAALAMGIRRLEQQGHTVHNYYQPQQKFQRFGGTDAGRLAQLNAAASDPDVQVVLALRGSYGISRILPDIDFPAMADSGKLFVGYSDFTAFHMALMKQTGRISFAGPMVCDDFIREQPVDYTLDQLWDCLRGPTHTIHGQVGSAVTGPPADGVAPTAPVAPNPVVELEGRLWGGNLAMLVSLLGTPYFAPIEQGIVFIEDVNEHPYRVERMILQLLYAGALDGQRALLLGDLSGYRLSPADNGYDFHAMLAYLRERLPMPVLTGLPFGHVRVRATLPYGGLARVVSRADGFAMTISGYPTL